MFRIIAGKWKAKRVAAPKNFEVRPTTDFAKEALFSILENRYDLEFCSVLDLFAGIGSISMEFASRYCNDITSVESNPKHSAFIHNTAADLDFALQINVQRADVFEWVKKNRQQKSYDIIFADPPFELDDKKYSELVETLLSSGFLKENGTLILEHQSRKNFPHELYTDTRKYGNVAFSFYKNEAPSAEITEPSVPE